MRGAWARAASLLRHAESVLRRIITQQLRRVYRPSVVRVLIRGLTTIASCTVGSMPATAFMAAGRGDECESPRQYRVSEIAPVQAHAGARGVPGSATALVALLHAPNVLEVPQTLNLHMCLASRLCVDKGLRVNELHG